MNNVILKGFIEIPEDDLEAVKLALVQHKELTLQEEGCIVFSVTQRTDTPLIFDVYEEFNTKEAFIKHQKRVANSAWGSVSKNVKRHYKVDELE